MRNMKIAALFILLLLSSCSVNRGNIPIIVKKLEQREIDYRQLKKIKSKAVQATNEASDCMHIFVFIPNKLTLSFDEIIKNSCSDSNYSFDNNFSTSLFYVGYGRECFINEYSCAID